ncbi:MAG: hypothetical protein AAB370_11000 [Verrucomicrobiota bacterium]
MKEQIASLHIAPLTQINLPDGDHASACILQFPRRRILLTVAHAVANGKNWTLAHRYVPGKGMQHYQLGGMNVLQHFELRKRKIKSHPIDFAYVTVPDSLEPMDEVLDSQGNVISSRAKKILPARFIEPSPEQTYGFFGLTRHRLDDEFHLLMTSKLETGLKYVGEKDGLLRFKCRERYHDYEEYHGCSGAPVLNELGELVSLVVEGSDDRREILGLNLKRCWPALLVEAGEFSIC